MGFFRVSINLRRYLVHCYDGSKYGLPQFRAFCLMIYTRELEIQYHTLQNHKFFTRLSGIKSALDTKLHKSTCGKYYIQRCRILSPLKSPVITMKCGVAGHALVAINLHKKDAKSLLYIGLLVEGKVGEIYILTYTIISYKTSDINEFV